MPNRRSGLLPPLVQAVTGLAAALSVACTPFWAPPPPTPAAMARAAAPTMVIDRVAVEAARSHLAGRMVSDYSRTLVGSAAKWAQASGADPAADAAAAGPAAAAQRRLMALGDPQDPDWPAAGLDLRGAPFNITPPDRATNGFAVRNVYAPYGKRVFLVTQAGKFFGFDPDNPLTGYTRVNLPGNFTKTYVTLSPEGSTAFVVSDAGRVYAINVANVVAGAPATHNYKTLNLAGLPTARGAALYMDPMSVSFATGAGTLYAVDNAGAAHRVTWSGTGGGGMTEPKFAAATLAEPWAPVSLPLTAPATSAVAFDGGDLVKSPPVVLNNRLIVGDRAGNVIAYQYAGPTGNGGAKTRWTVNWGWAIETPCALDVDDTLAVTDIFAAAGAQLFWVKPATGTVYTGQYALVENGGNSAVVDATNLPTYVTTTAGQLKPTAAADDYTSFSSTVGPDDAIALPGSATNRDVDHLSYAGFLAGLPPTMQAFAGQTGRRFYDYYPWDVNTGTNAGDPVRLDTAPNYSPPGPNATHQVAPPVQDGTTTATAQLLSPSAIEFDDDGSWFVADTNHCQVLFTPADAAAWQRWFPSPTSVLPTVAYDAMADPANRYNWLAGAVNKPNDGSASTRFYVFAGTLFPNAPNNDALWSGDDEADGNGAGRRRDVGNGSRRPNTASGPGTLGGKVGDTVTQAANPGPIARGTPINRVQGLAVGNLGLYIANRNAFQTGTNRDGQILFMPRNNLPAGTYFGITNPQPGELYTIAAFTDPQGLDVWRGAGADRDIVFAPSMNTASGPSRNRVYRLDSASAAAGISVAACRIAGLATGAAGNPTNGAAATGQALNNPYDVCLDDSGNLFVAQTGNGYLSMIAKAVSQAEGAPAPAACFNWGTAGVAGAIYNINTGLSAISSVTFAANDPQLPAGQRCLYIALGSTPPDYEGALPNPNRVVRMDQSLYYRSVAGPPLSAPAYRNTGIVAADELAGGDAGDGLAGDAAAVRLAMPWRARGRFNTATGNFETYICDRGNNRIRRIVSSAATSSARGYMCFPWPTGGAAHWGKPIYQATLSLFSRAAAGALTPPVVGLVPPRLKNGLAWNNAILAATPGIFTPSVAPDLDLATGQAFPQYPTASLTTPWPFLLQNATGDAAPPYDGAAGAPIPYQWRLPASQLVTSGSNADYQHLRLGMQAPSGDGSFYYYPTSPGTFAAPNVKSADFWTTNGCPAPGAANFAPRVDYRWGNRAIQPILSAPTIVYHQTAPGVYDGTRYVYLMNANAMWRYDVTTPAAFIDAANGARVAFAKTIQGQAAAGTIYPYGGTSYQFNSTAPVAGLNGRLYAIDIHANSTTQYTYWLNEFDGDLATATPTMYVDARQIAVDVPTSSTTDNAGIYMAADYAIAEGYFGLADGKIYRLQLNAGAP